MAQTDKEFLIRVKADLDAAVAGLRQLSKEIDSTGDRSEDTKKSTDSLGDSIGNLAKGFAAYLSIANAIKALRMIDEWNAQQQRIKAATKETGDYVRVSKELYDISQRNGAAMADTVATFQRLATARTELKATNDEILKVTNAVQQMGILSGASGSAMQAGMLQFGQAMSAGVVRAEEFNSILENMPALAARIADGMGMTVGQLRQAVLDGEVLSRSVFDAILNQTDQIAADMAEMPANMDRAWTSAVSASARFLANIKEASFVGALVTQSIQGWTDMMNAYSDAVEAENMLPEIQRQRAELLRLVRMAEEHVAWRESRNLDSTGLQAHLASLRTQLEALGKQIDKTNASKQQLLDARATAGSSAPAILSQKELDAQIKAVNKSLKDQTKLFEQQASVVKKAQQQVAEVQSGFDAARRTIRDQGRGPNVIGTGYDLLQAEGKLGKGDYQAALDAANDAKTAILEMGQAGKVSTLALEGLLAQAERIGVEAAKGIEGKEQAKLDAIKAEMTDLLAKSENLKALKVGFDADGALAEAATLRGKLQAQFDANPLQVPVITTQIGAAIPDSPTTRPGAAPITGQARTPGGTIQAGDKVIRYRVEVDDSSLGAQMAAVNQKAQAAATPVVKPIVMTMVNGVPSYSNDGVNISDTISDEALQWGSKQ